MISEIDMKDWDGDIVAAREAIKDVVTYTEIDSTNIPPLVYLKKFLDKVEALVSIKQPASAAVPEAKSGDGLRDIDRAYVHGWNACRTAMLSAAPPPPGAKPLPLTEERVQSIWNSASGHIPGCNRHIAYARAIEAAHNITGEPK